MTDLKKIFIRAKGVDGKWASFSLDELVELDSSPSDPLDTRPAAKPAFDGVGQIKRWLIDKYIDHVGLEEGAALSKKETKKMISRIVDDMEKLGITIYKLK